MNESLVKTDKPRLPARLYQAIKAAFQMRFSGYGGSHGQAWGNGWSVLSSFFTNSRINWTTEVGDLTQASVVMAPVNWLARVLPQAPLRVMASDTNGKEKPVIPHDAIALLKKPNEFYSGVDIWKSYALSWIITGNVYWIKVRNGFGQVVALWNIPPVMMTPIWPENGSGFISYYQYEVDGRLWRIDVKDVIHFKDIGDPKTQGRTGLSPIASVLREICADNEVPLYHYLLLKAGGVPPVVLSLKDGQSGVDFDAKKVKDTYIAATSGDQRGKVFVSGNAVELTKVGFNPAEMDLKILRHLPESRVASVIGIAKETLGFGVADEGSTYNNVEQADKRTIKTFVAPLWDYIEDRLTTELGPDFGLAENERFSFDRSEVAALQEDQDLLHARAKLDLECGGIMIDEFREMIGRPPAPEGMGQVFLWPSGVQPMTPQLVKLAIERAANPPEPQPAMLGDGQQPPKQLINGKAHREEL